MTLTPAQNARLTNADQHGFGLSQLIDYAVYPEGNPDGPRVLLPNQMRQRLDALDLTMGALCAQMSTLSSQVSEIQASLATRADRGNDVDRLAVAIVEKWTAALKGWVGES